MNSYAFALSFAVLVAACSHPKPPIAPPAPAPGPAPTSQTEIERAILPAPEPVSPSLAVSEDIARLCRLDLDNIHRAPKFDFDRSELLGSDWDVLAKIARCVTDGTLGDVRLELIGRADPRGETDYNLALGARRAHAVASALLQLGVDPDRLEETSRGALDATGTEESTWAVDRRVDIVSFRPLPREQ